MPQSQVPVEGRTHQAVAESAAAYAHYGFFSSRRGILPSCGHLVVAYDNNPPERDATACRSLELDVLKVRMEEAGCTLVGEASYPQIGDSPGYTVALVWRSNGPGREDVLASIWEDILTP